jgi:putative N-acetylmannosamine-6-phosphate epimerase
MCKLIVSIQGYSETTTKELSEIALKNGAEMIRTDKNIDKRSNTIGLVKNYKYKNYITPTIPDMDKVNEYANYIAIDCRQSNIVLKELLNHAKEKEYQIVCDIETLEDLKKLLNIYEVEIIATTFDYDKKDKLKILKEITEFAKKYNIVVIAEGGYNGYTEMLEAQKIGVDYICIGQAISKIDELTKKYKGYLK